VCVYFATSLFTSPARPVDLFPLSFVFGHSSKQSDKADLLGEQRDFNQNSIEIIEMTASLPPNSTTVK